MSLKWKFQFRPCCFPKQFVFDVRIAAQELLIHAWFLRFGQQVVEMGGGGPQDLIKKASVPNLCSCTPPCGLLKQPVELPNFVQ